MKNILVISSDPRADALIGRFQPLLKVQIGSVADFDHGLKEVFDKRPAVVFIQSEISGIAGDAVAKHIKGLLRDDSPKLVLLRDAPERPTASRNTFDESIDLFMPEEDLSRVFRAQLEKIPSLQWREKAEDEELKGKSEAESGSPEPVGTLQQPPPPPLSPSDPPKELKRTTFPAAPANAVVPTAAAAPEKPRIAPQLSAALPKEQAGK